MEKIKDIYDDIISWFRVKYEMIERIIFYGWNSRFSYDFDAHSVYHSIYLKLDRVYDTMLNHSHCVWNSDPKNNLMRKLNTARILARRLYEDDYFQNELIPHNKMWGKHTITWGEGGMLLEYENANTEEEKEQAQKEFMRCRNDGGTQMMLEKKELFRLLEKYLDHFWD